MVNHLLKVTPKKNGTFKADYIGDTLKIRVYSPTDTATKDFTYTYTLKKCDY